MDSTQVIALAAVAVVLLAVAAYAVSRGRKVRVRADAKTRKVDFAVGGEAERKQAQGPDRIENVQAFDRATVGEEADADLRVGHRGQTHGGKPEGGTISDLSLGNKAKIKGKVKIDIGHDSRPQSPDEK
jgi:hypothetical protein